MKNSIFIWGAIFFVLALPVHASFEDFVGELKAEASKKGMDPAIIDQAFNGDIKPINKAVSKSKKQPEFSFTFNRYLTGMLSKSRIEGGRERILKYTDEMAVMEKKYGIPRGVLTALWGVESHYGIHMGKFPVIPSLATLAYKSHRKEFFKKEFFNALKIVNEGHIPLNDFKGSWAGAMGQCQFMPSSFLSYAVDGNGDGKKDIWQTAPDVLASSANYLKKNGWKAGQRWGQRVVLTKYLPAGLKLNKHKLSQYKTMKEWKKLGISNITGEKLPKSTSKARLFLPQGPSKKAYLVYDNFDVIMRWNHSSAFAFSVLSLADILENKSDA